MRSIRYLILVLTTRCNLRCRYCYNGDASVQGDMSESVLDRALEMASEGDEPLHIQITGGEPALVPDLVNVVLARAREKIRRPYSVGFQTNGTLLNSDLIRMLKEFNVQVGISVDGLPSVHESLRGDARSTFRSLSMLEALGVPFRVTAVVTAQNVLFLDKLLLALAGFEFCRGIGLDLLVRKGRALSSEAITPPSPGELRRSVRSLLQALELVNKRRSVPVTVREFEKLWRALSSSRSQGFCHAAEGRSIAVMPDGSIFPCGQTAGDERFLLGDVWNHNDDKRRALVSIRLSGDSCENCPLADLCPGDCPSRVFYNQNDAGLACEMYRTMWEFLVESQ